MIRLDKCACGGTVYVNTDGNGRSFESCDRCHSSRFTPRALPLDHPVLAEFARTAAAARAEVESHRHDLPLCPDCGTNHVWSPKADRCAECTQVRRRRLEREKYAARQVLAQAVA